ncbi:MAG: A/G-specific adenine glycosylase [Burkholderiaceae bacterium]
MKRAAAQAAADAPFPGPVSLPDFAARVVAWQPHFGRSSLPWQGTRDPYLVWLSEVMLQQTQVATVLTYFPRFVARFPHVLALAAASQDEVLGLWSGLGYYSRARNLHRCAQVVARQHGGQFPASAEGLQTLPGIGRSTAAAIAAFCYGQRVAILDGNVKRVLTRLLGFDGDLALAANERALWDLATGLLPPPDLLQAEPAAMARYTQGLMDLGARVCARRQPDCAACPARGLCVAERTQSWDRYPVKTRKLKRSAQDLWLLLARTAGGAVWLQRRPERGIWAGLHCVPVFESRAALLQAVAEPLRARLQDAPSVRHSLTHKELLLTPLRLDVPAADAASPVRGPGQWLMAAQWQVLGLPAPIRLLLGDGTLPGPVPIATKPGKGRKTAKSTKKFDF